MKYKTLLAALLLSAGIACGETKVKLHFRNVIDGRPLVLNDSTYTNALGQVYSLSMCKYYISNVAFIKTDGTAVNIENSYHLVNEAKPSSHIYTIQSLPEGEYTAVKFLIGVDSLHNVSGAQDGELDPVNAMFWDWNTGYIMAKIEGRAKDAVDGDITYHIGGFSGSTSSLRWVTIALPRLLTMPGNAVISLDANIAEWLKTPATIDFSKMPVVTLEGKEAAMIADN